MAAVLAAGPGALLSHRSAAVLWGFAPSEGRIHVIGRDSRTNRLLSPTGFPPVHFHRTNFLHDEDRTVRHGISLTSVPRTFIDIAGSESTKHLQILVNEATRSGCLDIDAMRRILLRTTGKRGIGKLERIINRWHPVHTRSKSDLEDICLELLREAGLPEPRVNEWILGMQVDLWWPKYGLIVELDSRQFHEDDRGHEQDRERTARLELAGYRVLRLTWAMVTDDPEKTVQKIRHYFRLASLTSAAANPGLAIDPFQPAG